MAHLGKTVVVNDADQALLDIHKGDVDDIRNLKIKMGITVQEVRW